MDLQAKAPRGGCLTDNCRSLDLTAVTESEQHFLAHLQKVVVEGGVVIVRDLESKEVKMVVSKRKYPHFFKLGDKDDKFFDVIMARYAEDDGVYLHFDGRTEMSKPGFGYAELKAAEHAWEELTREQVETHLKRPIPDV